MKCSIIILNWNGAKMLREFLPSVVKHTALPDCEVVVADNGSIDESEKAVSEFPSVRWMPLGKNYGFAEGYNRAIAQVESDYVVLLNSDVEVTDGWLTALMAYMDSHPQVAACQPKIRKFYNKRYFEHAGAAGGYMDILGYPYCRGRVLDKVEEDRGQYDESVTCFWASGACLLVRARIYKEVGGLDSDFFAHMEEIDLCWRMQARGWQVACEPAAVVYHVGGASLNYGNPRKTYLNFRNNLLMLYKNAEWYRLIGILPIRFVLDYVALGNDLIHGRMDNAFAIIKARLDFWRLVPSFYAKRRENRRKQVAYIAGKSLIFIRLWQMTRK